MAKTYKELKESVDKLQEDLFSIMRKEKMSMRALSLDIGITQHALTKFFNNSTQPQVTLLMAIEDYIHSYEKKA